MASWMGGESQESGLGAGPTAANETQVEILRLQRIIREQNVLSDTARAEQDKLQSELHELRLLLKESQGKASYEADARTKAQAELEKQVTAAKSFNALKVNYENTIQAQEDKMRALTLQAKQAEKGQFPPLHLALS